MLSSIWPTDRNRFAIASSAAHDKRARWASVAHPQARSTSATLARHMAAHRLHTPGTDTSSVLASSNPNTMHKISGGSMIN
jgi:hypothetical protein